MKHVIRKAYWDFEKEEKWINEMATKGLTLTDYSWCRYVFEDTVPGTYTYKIILLKEKPTHPESIQYLRFLEDTGIECAATYMRWVYLRKKASDGPFDLFTDLESHLKHYQSIHTFWSTLITLNFIAGFYNLFISIINWSRASESPFPYINFVCFVISMLAAVLLFKMESPVRRKIKNLKSESTIRE